MTSAPASAPLKIAIAGAGIGGLSTALALARQGIQSTVFERRSDPSEAGAGIQLGPNATGVLARLGVLDAVRSVAAEPDALTVHDGRSGRVLARFPLGAWMRERHGAPYLTLHRPDLHHALLDATKTDARVSIDFGRAVEGFENLGTQVEVRLGDGQTVAADALITADGLWSQLRTQIAPSSAPQPSEKCAYRAVIPHSALPSQLAANDVHIWLAPGVHVVHYPVNRGVETAIVVVIDGDVFSDDWNSSATAEGLRGSAVQHLAWPVREMILSQPVWGMWRLHTIRPLARWTNGRVALLGDAAHPVMPFFAQGGGLAIEDAIVLANCIAAGGALTDGLQAYERLRRARTQRVTEASITNGRIYHLGGATARARNAVLSTVPGSLMMRKYDWLYGWKP